MRVCTGSWQHDLSQARVVEDIPGVDLEVGSAGGSSVASIEKESILRLGQLLISRVALALFDCSRHEPAPCLQVFPFDSHRLAKWLDSQGRLEVLVEDAICTALGSGRPQRVRLANLL